MASVTTAAFTASPTYSRSTPKPTAAPLSTTTLTIAANTTSSHSKPAPTTLALSTRSLACATASTTVPPPAHAVRAAAVTALATPAPATANRM